MLDGQNYVKRNVKKQIILTDHSCAHDLLERPNMGKEERG